MSTNEIDFKSLWQQQSSSAPNIAEFLHEAKVYQQKNKWKQGMLNVMLLLTCLVIVSIWIYYQPQLIATKIGIVLALLAIVSFLLASNKLLLLSKLPNESDEAKYYLKALINYKTKQRFIQTKVMSLYFIMLSVGLALYLYEYVNKGGQVFTISVYSVTFAWIAFNWFYLRPKQIKKQNEKLDAMIAKLKSIQDDVNGK
jgi:hypothetical protein